LLPAFLVGLAAYAGAPALRFFQRNVPLHVPSGAAGGAGGGVVSDFSFAPDGGAGLVAAASSLCGLLDPSEKVGAWHCLEGDGTSTAWDGGTGVFTEAHGNATTQTRRSCPNGPDCAELTRNVLASGDTLETAAIASGTGSLTACILFMRDNPLGADDIFPFGQTNLFAASSSSWRFYLGAPTGTAHWLVSDGSTNVDVEAVDSSALAAGPSPHAETLLCGTWSAANGVIAYLDGNASAASALATRNNVSVPLVVNGIQYNDDAYRRGVLRVRGVFVTYTELSAARILALSKSALGYAVTGTGSEPLVFTRGRSRSCAIDDNASSLSLIGPDVPCITRGGIDIWRNVRHSALQSERFDQSPWTDVATPTVTADAVLSPEGSTTADTLTDDSAAASEGRAQSIATTDAVGHAFNVWLKAGTETSAIISMTGTGSSLGDRTCRFTNISSSDWRRYSCVSQAPYSSAVTAVSVAVLVGSFPAATGTLHTWGADFQTAAGSVGAGVTSAPYALPYATTYASEIESAHDRASFAIARALAPISMAATVARGASPPQKNGRYYLAYKAAIADAVDEVHMFSRYDLEDTLVCGESQGQSVSKAGLDGTDVVACDFKSDGIKACVGGLCSDFDDTSGPFTDGGTVLWLGQNERHTSNWQPDGIISNVCLSSTIGNCTGNTATASSDSDVAAAAPALLRFSSSDAGDLGTACACAATAGMWSDAGSAPLTTTRASVATCLPASQTANIQPGQMVRCAANQLRVTTMGSGPLKVLSESAGTNAFATIGHITEDFNSASWTKAGTVGVFANDAGAPDGTNSADGIQLAATSGSGFSSMYQSAVAATAPATVSLFVVGITPPDGGVAQSGTMDVCGYDSTSWTCTACANAAWPNYTRCSHTITGGTPVSVHFGNLSIYNGGVARGAHSVAFWGAQMETGAKMTSYQPPDAGSRAVETHKFAALPDAMNTGCAAISYVPQFDTYTGNWGPSVVHGAAAAPIYGEGNNVKMYDGTTALARSLSQDGGAKRIRAWWSAVDGGMQICNDTDSSCSAVTAYDKTMPIGGGALLDFCSAVQIGTFAGKAACYDLIVDQDPTRCGP
jgi:hypothetical protein